MDTMLRVLVIIVVVIAILVFGLAWRRRRGRPGTVRGGAGHDDWDEHGDEGASPDDDGHWGGGHRAFQIRVREPWFEEMTKGKKTVVGRLRKGAFAKDARRPLKAKDPVTVARSRAREDTTEYPGVRRYDTEVVSVTDYTSFSEMLKKQGPDKVFPGKSASSAEKELEKFYTEEDLAAGHGVVAIEVEPPTAAALKPKPRR